MTRAGAFAWAAVLGGPLLLAAGPRPADGPLRVHPDNPRWFASPDGRAVWLTGAHTWAAFQERGVAGQTPDFDFPLYLDFLQGHGHNAVRLWVWEHAQWMQFAKAGVPVRYEPLAYPRPGPGLALDGQPKFDLSRFNEDFFRRLRERVEAAGRRGLYVIVMLFQGFSVQKKGVAGGGNQWHGHPFHKANNVNGIDGDPSGKDTGHETHTLRVPAVVRLQEAYVRRMVDALGDLDNVLWEIGNELHEPSVEWQYHMIRFLGECEKARPKRHLIGMTGAPIRTPELMAGPADWISPPGKEWLDRPPAADGKKIVVVDTDHCSPWDHKPAWVWKCLTRGHHFLLMDGYMDYRIGAPREPNPAWDPTRRAMGAALRLTRQLDLARLTPQPALASSGFCLADEGRTYVVHHEGDGPLDLSAAPGRYRARTLDPVSGEERRRDTAAAEGGPVRFPAPARGGEVLVLERTGP